MTTLIGIDFGSTYSRGAFWNAHGIPEVLRDETHLDSTALLPSAVLKQKDGTLAVGWLARRKRMSEEEPVSLKRQWLGGKAEAAPSVGLVLKEIKTRAEHILKKPVEKAAFSVSVLMDPLRRREFETAVQAAGFDVLGLIPESAAAALAYGYLKSKNGIAAIYNFGGGLFECGIVRFGEKKVHLLGAEGTELGGEDLDLCVARNILKEIGGSASFQSVLEESEKARCALSHRGSYDFQIADPKFGRAFSRFELAKWVREAVEKTAGICESAMKKAGVTHQDIHEVILTGGVTRMPFVHETVEKIFRKKTGAGINPDLAVVFGTLIYASLQSGKIKDWEVKF